MRWGHWLLCACSGAAGAAFGADATAESSQVRPDTAAHVRVARGAADMPATLSQTGLLADPANGVASASLLPYELNVPFWSDGARKQRWIAVPDGSAIRFAAQGSWTFPAGTIFVKTFELPLDERQPQKLRRLETRVLVRDARGDVFGVVYKWRADGSDADLLQGARTETLRIRTKRGQRAQDWYYPSSDDCLECHTPLAGGVLGVNSRQLNRVVTTSNGPQNQLLQWSRMGLFSAPLGVAQIAALTALAGADDDRRSVEDRARSYLDVNCAQCHRPGGTVAYFDARYETPLAQQGLIDGAILIDQGIDRARVVAPNDRWRSILLLRTDTLEDLRMPPLARNVVDRSGVRLLQQWIESLPGRPVLPPPQIGPAVYRRGGTVSIVLSSAQGATIRYTTDGTAPDGEDSIYDGPIRLTPPVILRARAFAPGWTQSIVAQRIVGAGP